MPRVGDSRAERPVLWRGLCPLSGRQAPSVLGDAEGPGEAATGSTETAASCQQAGPRGGPGPEGWSARGCRLGVTAVTGGSSVNPAGTGLVTLADVAIRSICSSRNGYCSQSGTYVPVPAHTRGSGVSSCQFLRPGTGTRAVQPPQGCLCCKNRSKNVPPNPDCPAPLVFILPLLRMFET